MDLISTTIRSAINLYDEAQFEPDSEDELCDKEGANIIGNDHFQLRSPLPSQTLRQIEDDPDPIFLLFCRQLGKFFSEMLGKHIQLNWEQTVCINTKFILVIEQCWVKYGGMTFRLLHIRSSKFFIGRLWISMLNGTYSGATQISTIKNVLTLHLSRLTRVKQFLWNYGIFSELSWRTQHTSWHS